MKNGITLIALVVTIVVLLILAGITITYVLGEDGIIAQAKLAAEKTRIEELRSVLEMIHTGLKTDQIIEGFDDTEFLNRYEGKLNNEKENGALKGAIIERKNEGQEGDKIQVTKDDYTFDITAEGVTYTGKGEGGGTAPTDPVEPTPETPTQNEIAKQYGKKQTENKTIPLVDTSITVPKGYTLVDPTTDETIEYADPNNPTVNDGLVIKDDVGNEFVWVPVKEINEMVMCQTHPTITINFDEATGQFTCNGEGHNGAEPKLAGKLYAGDYDNSTDTYPFEPDKASWSYTPNSDLREPAIVTGNNTGNGTSYDGDQTNLNDVVEGDQKTKEKFLEQLQNEFNEMAKSVAKYKGFYIGRYETGNLEASDTTPVVKKYNTEIGGPDWYWQYKNSKKIAQRFRSNKQYDMGKSMGCNNEMVYKLWTK